MLSHPSAGSPGRRGSGGRGEARIPEAFSSSSLIDVTGLALKYRPSAWILMTCRWIKPTTRFNWSGSSNSRNRPRYVNSVLTTLSCANRWPRVSLVARH